MKVEDERRHEYGERRIVGVRETVRAVLSVYRVRGRKRQRSRM